MRRLPDAAGEAALQGDLGGGRDRWRNPDDDLPTDFEANRAENYAKLRKPLDPQVFIDQLRSEMDAELSALNDALGGKGLAWLKIAERRGAGAIQLTPLDAAPDLPTA
ncbi:hypothetical protein [Planotetraspora sp. GP83]|uniref:hypothetical protein n=1 Tax=Planotetraspora sp. GP83 TaxID=3156264 RepID=UPI0035157F10